MSRVPAAVTPLYDWYYGFLLNCDWLIAVLYEGRGSKLRW